MARSPLTNAELSRREPVWLAFSEFWLDIELDHTDLARIAEIARASGHSRAELRAIYLHEVAPVVGTNLFSVAGVWEGFDPAWLSKRCRRRAERPPRWPRLATICRLYLILATERHWRVIERALPADPAKHRDAA